MDHDPTEAIRRRQQAEMNAMQDTRAEIEARYGKCWDTEELRKEFAVLGFAAPYVVVERIADGKKGSLMFRHHPRLYFRWEEDR